MASLNTLSSLGFELTGSQRGQVNGAMMTTPRWVFCMYFPEWCYPERY